MTDHADYHDEYLFLYNHVWTIFNLAFGREYPIYKGIFFELRTGSQGRDNRYLK